jgi:hypothetical protein
MSLKGLNAMEINSNVSVAMYEALGKIIVAMIERESDQELKDTKGITDAIKEIGSALMTVEALN